VLLHPKNPTVKNYALSKKHNNKTKKNLATKNWKKNHKKGTSSQPVPSKLPSIK
jgi:hypothetical protein